MKHTSAPLKSLKLQGKDKQIHSFLKTVPHLEFSDKGIENISKRFGITPERLRELIEAYRKEEQNGN